MASKKDATAVADVETINQGEFIDRLGINQVVWTKHPEYREWLEKQEGVVYLSRKSFIPVHLVDALRDHFNVQPVQRRPRKNKGAATTERGVNYRDKPVAELLELLRQESALLNDGKADELEDRIQTLRRELREAEDAQSQAKGAEARVERIQAALNKKREDLEAARKAAEEEIALLTSAG